MTLRSRLLACASALSLLITAPATAQLMESYNASPGVTIPDGDLVGVASTINIPFSSITQITSVSVTLQITGGFNGDFYAYLVHYLPNSTAAGFVTLLNRVGVTGSDPVGYGDSGFNVTFDAMGPDIHLYQGITNPGGAALTGTWGPDGRTDSPLTVTDASARLSSLASFNGGIAAGTWTLFIADVAGGDIGTFTSWGITIQGVPEPGTVAAGAFALATVVTLARRRRQPATATA